MKSFIKWFMETVTATKAEVDYVDYPINNQKCSECTMFRCPNKCTAVEGDISPEGWCIWWTYKEH